MLDRILGARRTQPTVPARSHLSTIRSLAGVPVDDEAALTYSAVWAAVKVISETVAMLPWRAYREVGGRRQLLGNSTLDYTLFREANSHMSPFVFKEYLVSCALLQGNGYAEIVRDGSGEAAELWPLHPGTVTPTRDGAGRLVYEVRSDRGQITTLRPQSVLHIKGPTHDGLVGRSVIAMARESWGLGIAAEQFASAFYGNGATPSLVITQTGEIELSKEGADNMLESFERRHRGPAKAGKPGLLEAGFDLKPIGIPQKDAQFIESRKFQVSEVARWFRLPPHKLADLERATFSNIEEQGIEFVTDSIQPWVRRLEEEADMKLAPAIDITTRMDLTDMLRGNSEARAAYYTKMRDLGAVDIDEIRIAEGLNPLGPERGGDLRLVPLNMVAVERARQGGGTDSQSSMRAVVVDALERMTTKEQNAAERHAAKNETLEAWGQTFYERHEQQLIDALMPGAMAAAQAVGCDSPDLVRRIVGAAAHAHVARSIRDIARGEWRWQDRAGHEADQLLGQLVGATHA